MDVVKPTLNHTHDCELCAYLGSFISDQRQKAIDCYVCDGSLIMRFGSDGPDYGSFPIDIARMWVNKSADWKRLVDLYDAHVMEGFG